MLALFAAIVFWLGVAAPTTASAETAKAPNPSLTALDRGVDDRGRERPLQLSRIETDVSIAGTLAETTITAAFANPGSEPVEGRFRLALPRGSIVTGYALDIGGEMIDGVLLDQPKAREIYTDKVRRGIDPGLAEVSRDAVFSTRVFPIFPGSGRTIRVRFVTAIDPADGLVLPLSGAERVAAMSVRLRISDVAAAQAVRIGGETLRLAGGSGSFTGEASFANARLDSLRIAAPRPSASLLHTAHRSGDTFFQLSDAVARSDARLAPARLRIYWDRSRSRLDDRLDDEAALVRRLIERLAPSATDIVLFGSAAPQIRTVATGRDAEALLNGVRYRGATSFEGLGRITAAPADLCLIFSDGISTISRRDPLRPGCLLHAVTSAADADLPFLRAVAGGSGGEAMVLGDDPRALAERLSRRRPAIVDIRTEAGAPVEYALLDGGGDQIRAVGRAPDAGALIVTVAGPSGPERRRYPAPPATPAHDAAAAFWAADRVAMLAGDPAQAPVFKDLATRYSVAGPEMAFVVLETPNDYVQDEVAPPDTYPKPLRAAYAAAKTEFDRRKMAELARWGETLAERWAAQKIWWSTRYDPLAKPRGVVAQAVAPPPLVSPAAPPPPPPVQMADVQEEPPPPEEDDACCITVTGSRVSRPNLETATPITTVGGETLGRSATRIELTPWKPDRPYLRALDARPDDFERVFLVLEVEHGALPAFYLDVADWLHKRGRKAEAVETLVSALELPAANNETIGIVAARLLRYGELDRAIYLLERLAAAETFRPQPKRALALALAARAKVRRGDLARADYDRALALLEEVIETPPTDDYQGIELISLMEANALLPAYRRAGGTRRPFDPRLVALLDTDLRVVIDWSSGNNDLDLWVTEPTGDKSHYGNTLTRAGGRISNDMTSGYGPEEYLIRRAVPGAYAVSVNAYAPDRIDPNGAPVLTARLIRDFGRPSEREEVVDIELQSGSREQRPVGRLVVAAR